MYSFLWIWGQTDAFHRLIELHNRFKLTSWQLSYVNYYSLYFLIYGVWFYVKIPAYKVYGRIVGFSVEIDSLVLYMFVV
jgi:hypothetical protein